MTDFPITVRGAFGPQLHVFSHYSLGVLTVAVDKWHWVVPFNAVIVDVICNSEVAGAAGTADIIDVNKNGTTIYTTQANRPTLLAADTGKFTEAGEPEIRTLRAGDILSYDVDAISTTASSKFSITIIIAQR